MLTINMIENKPAVVCRKICISPLTCDCSYTEGLIKPNYPVPAIRTDVVIYPGEVTIYSDWLVAKRWGTRYRFS